MRIAIAAGGTGGHIYPALALGERLKSDFGYEVDYLCGERELEQSIYRGAGEAPVVFPARQIRGGPMGKLGALGSAFRNVLRAMRLCHKREYRAVVGMGGYVAGPAVLGGFLAGRTTAIHESNAIPGRTNKILAPIVTFTAVHFAETLKCMRARRGAVVGMPIRASVLAGDRREGLEHFGLRVDVPTLLIVGGSQGAKHLYENTLKALPLLDRRLSGPWQVLWSTGKNNIGFVSEALTGVKFQNLYVTTVPYLERMDLALAVSDVALARAGSSSMAELLSKRIPAIYVPFPAAIYDHQTLNAQAAVAANAGQLLAERDLSPEVLAGKLHQLCTEQVRPLQQLPEGLDSSRAASRLAGEIVALIRR